MFGFGKNRFLGIDIGTYSIKVLELVVKGGRPTIENYAWISLDDLKGGSHYSFNESWLACLKKMINKADFKSNNAYVSIPAAGALITLVEFPNIARDDLDQAIKFEAHKYIPTSLDDVVLSWDVVSVKNSNSLVKKFATGGNLSKPEEPEGIIQVILVAAPKDKVEKYQDIIIKADLKLKSVEIDSFSLVRSLIGNDQGNFIIADIGSRICNIILVEKGVVKVNRNIDAGGRDVTNAITRNIGLDEERALQIKKSGKELLSGNNPVVVPAFDMITQEIKRVINDFYGSAGSSQLDSIVLSGGTANLNGIAEFFRNALNIRTVMGNPFGRIAYDEKLEPIISKIKTQFAVAAGLALKGAEEYIRK